MSRVTITCNDGFLFGALGYSIIVLIIKWSRYSDCDNPLQLFLLVDYVTIILFRMSHFFMQCVSETRLQPYAVCLKIGIIYPFFVAWTIVGTAWFRQSGSCLPESNQYWTFVIWLVLCYVWITLYSCLLICQICLGGGLRALNGGRRIDGFNGLNDADNNFPFPLQLRYQQQEDRLQQNEIDVIPTFLATDQETQKTCSICLENFRPGESLKKLHQCDHFFHSACIDGWLGRRNSCPLCRVPAVPNSSFRNSDIV